MQCNIAVNGKQAALQVQAPFCVDDMRAHLIAMLERGISTTFPIWATNVALVVVENTFT